MNWKKINEILNLSDKSEIYYNSGFKLWQENFLDPDPADLQSVPIITRKNKKAPQSLTYCGAF
jgi:hypothetical protein